MMLLTGVGGPPISTAAPAYTWTDTDAQAFWNANTYSGNDTLKAAFDTFFQDYKTAGTYSKTIAGWLNVTDLSGGTSSQRLAQMKFNFKDPRDLDAAFRMLYTGGPTASMNGWKPAGFGQYGNTKLVMSTVLGSSSDWSFTFYNLDSTLGVFVHDMGSWNSGAGRNDVSSMYESSSPNAYLWTGGGNSGGLSNNQDGLYTFQVSGGTNFKIFRNGNSTPIQSGTIASGANATVEVWVGCVNLDNSATNAAQREKCYIDIGNGTETASEIAAKHTAINNLQGAIETALSLSAGSRKKY